MKRNILNTLWMAAVLPLALASCQQEELPGVTDTAGAQVFSITVTDGGYHSDGNATGMTRATENGYSTEFTAGDACGLYIVRGSSMVQENVKLTATAGTDGILTWQPDAGVTLAGEQQGDTYFLYYPYRENMEDKTDVAATTDDAAFFAPLISGWQPAEDQSDYATGYTASDLMTAQGKATESSDGIVQLSFPMTHRMALAVVKMPKTVYHFTNTTGEAIPDYTVTEPVDFTAAKPYRPTPGTYRYLVNPSSTAITLIGSYDDDSKGFTVTLSGISSGNYKTYNVNDGTVVNIDYNLQVGDYLMTDGSLWSKDWAQPSDEQKANVAAIVFWTPAETDPTGRTTPASLADDKIMKADFPNCNHGLAVALKDFAMVQWQNRDRWEYVRDFQYSNSFTHPLKSDFVSIATGSGRTDNANRILGYQNTQVLLAYNKYCAENNKLDNIVNPAAALTEYVATNSAPKCSTGWFLPSAKELNVLCYKDVDDIWNATGTQTRDIVTNSFFIAGGEGFKTIKYWSSSESVYNRYSLYYNAVSVAMSSGWITSDLKSNTYWLRAVCAF